MVPWLLDQVLSINTEWKELKSLEKVNLTDLKKNLFSIVLHINLSGTRRQFRDFNQRSEAKPTELQALSVAPR